MAQRIVSAALAGPEITYRPLDERLRALENRLSEALDRVRTARSDRDLAALETEARDASSATPTRPAEAPDGTPPGDTGDGQESMDSTDDREPIDSTADRESAEITAPTTPGESTDSDRTMPGPADRAATPGDDDVRSCDARTETP
jgi:hypothetical protein